LFSEFHLTPFIFFFHLKRLQYSPNKKRSVPPFSSGVFSGAAPAPLLFHLPFLPFLVFFPFSTGLA